MELLNQNQIFSRDKDSLTLKISCILFLLTNCSQENATVKTVLNSDFAFLDTKNIKFDIVVTSKAYNENKYLLKYLRFKRVYGGYCISFHP